MNWAAIGAISEAIGAFGVIATLAYLAVQIRQNTIQLKQNTLAAQAAALNRSNTTMHDVRASIFSSPEIAELFYKGNSNPDDLTDMERLRYRMMLLNVTDSMVDLYTQTLVTDFAPEAWNTQGVNLVKRIMGTKGGTWFWSNFSETYPEKFRSEIDRILAGSDPN